MRIGKFEFTPALRPTLVTLLILPLLLGLGFWQLGRAKQKEVQQEAFVTRTQLPYVALTAVDPAAAASLYRKVVVEGHYDSRHQILLDNQIHNGQAGYHVFTPLRVSGNSPAVLVNRGWIPLGPSRQQLPDIALADTPVFVKGLLAQPANPGLRLSGDTEHAVTEWPHVVQYLDYAQAGAMLGYPLLPAVILLDPAAADGYQREWHPIVPGFGPERHQGYAVQWFALAITLIVIYIAVNTHRSSFPPETPQ